MSDKNGHDSPQTNGPKVPKHVAIIADGNGRWAKRRHLPRLAGHRAGVENMRRVLEALVSQGVEYVTLYAFSTENWRRPEHEVRGLMRILREAIDRETRALHEKGIRLVHVGRITRLSSDLQQAVERAQELTQNNAKATLCIAFDYGGRSEIIQAVKRLLADGVSPDDVDEEMFGSYLYTAGIPDPDLVIRTGDEQRLSNFLLWQTHYSEYFFTPTLWPDFNGTEVEKALQAYNQRMRRYGSLKVEA
jgi:undecaprenyl diphosphate synthase